MKLLLKIVYNGTAYCGFQSQKNGRSVQEVLTEAMSALFGRQVSVTGCSRTDAGVHALGFCAAVLPLSYEPGETWMAIPLDKLPRAAEHFLPCDIAIADACMVGDEFHPRYDVRAKEYLYKISDAPYRNPFALGRVWQLKKPVTAEGFAAMERCAAVIHGYRDYASFMAAGSRIEDTRRTVYSCTVTRPAEHSMELRISADGFLYNMVRIITGTLIDAAYGHYTPSDIERIMEAKDRTQAGRTAPACGLYLNDVQYNIPLQWGNGGSTAWR